MGERGSSGLKSLVGAIVIEDADFCNFSLRFVNIFYRLTHNGGLRINNSYWMGNLNHYYNFGSDYDAEYEAAINSVTPEDVKSVLQAILAQNNLIEITSSPKN